MQGLQVSDTGNKPRTKMNFSFVFMGSTHGFLDDFSKQKEIINKINPEIVLSEELEEYNLDSKRKYKIFLDKRYVSEMTAFEEIKKLTTLCFNKNINLVGIDFKNFGLDKSLQIKIKKQKRLTSEENVRLQKILEKREKRYLEKINTYKQKTKKTLVVIVGCWHLRDKSPLLKKLKNYKIIAPYDEKGKIMLRPSQSKIVTYYEKIENEK